MTNLSVHIDHLKEICEGEPREVLDFGISMIERGLADGVVPNSQKEGYAGISSLCNAAAGLTPEEIRAAELIDSMPWTDDMIDDFLHVFMGESIVTG